MQHHATGRADLFLFTLLFLTLAGAFIARGQNLPELFDAPWRGFDTGTISEVFGPAAFALGDIDGDGDMDSVVGNRYQSRAGISILKNRGDGTYLPPVIYQLPFDNSIGGVALADFDADGDRDIFATVPGGNTTLSQLAIWRNNGDGSFAPRSDHQTGGTAPFGIVAADFTGDGFIDVVTANYVSEDVSLLRHNGQAGAAAGLLAPVTFPVVTDTGTLNNVLQVAAADLNGDGRLDLAVGHTSRVIFEFDPYTCNTHSILLNTGSGNFSARAAYVGIEPKSMGAQSAVALADVNNDSKVDLIGGAPREVTFGTYAGFVSVRRGNGDGTFGTLTYYRLVDKAGSPRHISTADLNGDGFRDIIIATPSGRQGEGFSVLLNSGMGTFPAVASFYEASQQTFMALGADADGDAKTDVLTIANSSAAMTVHKNPGNGTFRMLIPYSGLSLTEAIENSDIDSDGDIDVVINDDTARIFKNNGDGSFATVANYTPPRNFADMKLRDLNGDGAADLLFGPDAEFPRIISATH